MKGRATLVDHHLLASCAHCGIRKFDDVATRFGLLACLELAVGHGDHQSSNGKRIVTNFGLYAVAALIALVVPLTIANAATWAARSGIGFFNVVWAPAGAVAVIAIITRSFAAYWLHRAEHHFSLLWRLHRIHHSDRQVDVSLSLRHHPLELFPAILVFAGVAVLLGLPVWAVLLSEAVMMTATFWEHLAIRVPGGARRRLEPWIVLPETHRLHHSAERGQTDSNYSTLTIIWDRLFGTFRSSNEAVTRIGLGDFDDLIADSLWKQLLLPVGSQANRGAPASHCP